jgi:hypothetical protein
VSRFRRTLATAAIGVMAAGGAVLTSAAGAAPAFAATQASPAPSPGSQTITVTAQRTGGAGTRDIEPCAVPGPAAPAGVTPATCGLPPSIACFITTPVPSITSSHVIQASVEVHCTSPITEINLDGTMTKSGFGLVSEWVDDVSGGADAFAPLSATCQAAQYVISGFAALTFPAGYTPSFGTIHHDATFTPTAKGCGTTTGGGGGGGGGGCSIAPPVPAQPAADQPRVIACP